FVQVGLHLRAQLLAPWQRNVGEPVGEVDAVAADSEQAAQLRVDADDAHHLLVEQGVEIRGRGVLRRRLLRGVDVAGEAGSEGDQQGRGDVAEHAGSWGHGDSGGAINEYQGASAKSKATSHPVSRW